MKQNSEVQSLKNQLNQLKQINENSKTEFTKLYSLLKARKEQCDTANHNLEQMRQEINKLFAQNTDLQNRLKQDTSEAQEGQMEQLYKEVQQSKTMYENL